VLFGATFYTYFLVVAIVELPWFMLLCPSYQLGEFQVIAALWVKQVEVAAWS
jgi:hypothetical protein